MSTINYDNCTLILTKVWDLGETAEDLKSACMEFILCNY